MLKDEEKLEQDKTDEVKASSSLVSDTESADKDLVELVENDIKEDETVVVSKSDKTDKSEDITDKDCLPPVTWPPCATNADTSGLS